MLVAPYHAGDPLILGRAKPKRHSWATFNSCEKQRFIRCIWFHPENSSVVNLSPLQVCFFGSLQCFQLDSGRVSPSCEGFDGGMPVV